MVGARKLRVLVAIFAAVLTLNPSTAGVFNPEVVESQPRGKRNIDWIPAFQLVQVQPQAKFRPGNHVLYYYIGALGKDGKFYRPRSEILKTEVFLRTDPEVKDKLIPGTVFVYPERIFRSGTQSFKNPIPNFRIGAPIARLAANNAELNLVSINDPTDIFLPFEVRYFSQIPRDKYGNPTLWATDRLGFSRSSIGRYGCVLATLAMMLDYLGINYNGEMDPGILNEKLKKAYTDMNISAFTAGDKLILDRAVEAASGGRARFVSLREEAGNGNKFDILDRELSLGRPVMVTVPSNTSRNREHYILVYARDDGDYLIKDPANENRTKLSEYSRFTPRGVIVPNDNRLQFSLYNPTHRGSNRSF